MTRVLIVDDHAIVRSGIRRLLVALPDAEILEAASGEEALKGAAGSDLDLVVLDLSLPGLGGLELLHRIARLKPDASILVFSTHAEPIYVTRAIEAGARGYVSKNAAPQELLAAVKAVLAGRVYIENEIAEELESRDMSPDGYLRPLTGREIEIMRLLARGLSLTQIATALGVAYKTVANSITYIKEKLGVSRTADLIRVAIDRGLM